MTSPSSNEPILTLEHGRKRRIFTVQDGDVLCEYYVMGEGPISHCGMSDTPMDALVMIAESLREGWTAKRKP